MRIALLLMFGRALSKRLVFLGTPEVAVHVLQALAASPYELTAVVTQPPAPAGRNKKLTPSPVHVAAEGMQLKVLSPSSAKDPVFLDEMERIAPDLCVTVVNSFISLSARLIGPGSIRQLPSEAIP